MVGCILVGNTGPGTGMRAQVPSLEAPSNAQEAGGLGLGFGLRTRRVIVIGPGRRIVIAALLPHTNV